MNDDFNIALNLLKTAKCEAMKDFMKLYLIVDSILIRYSIYRAEPPVGGVGGKALRTKENLNSSKS